MTPNNKQPAIPIHGLRMITAEDVFKAAQNELEQLNASPTFQDCFRSHALDPIGGFTIAKELQPLCCDSDMRWSDTDPQRVSQKAWTLIAQFFMRVERLPEAIAVLESLYYRLLKFETDTKEWLHKGTSLVWISDCYSRLNYPVHAKRYFMYTLCEDAIDRKGERNVKGSGVYARASMHGMTDDLVAEYHRVAYQKWTKLNEAGWFPERLLAEMDDRWMTEYPTAVEYGHYRTNPLYIQHLLSQLGSDKGQSLERLAHYLVSMIPGSRVYRRKRTESSDYDVVGSFEGPGLDFRSELGRYFVCECKDWDKDPADVTVMAKTAYFLDSVKSRFGILFSKNGISGDAKTKDAEREQLKVYSNRGIAIVVIKKDDMERMAKGENFLSMLRTRYEKVRLDIADDQLQPPDDEKPPANSAKKPREVSTDSKPVKRSNAKKKQASTRRSSK